MISTVLYVVDSLGLSGKTRSVAQLASHLDRQRFSAVVATLSSEVSPLTDELTHARVPVKSIDCRDGIDVLAIGRLTALMRSRGVDVVHCFNPRPMLYGGIAAKLAGVRQAIGSLSAFACQVPDRDYPFLPQALSTTSKKNVHRNRIAARLMRHIVAVSSSLGERFCRFNGIWPGLLKVVPYGVDLDAIQGVSNDEVAARRSGFAFDHDAIVVGSIGRLVEQKDYPTQLRAFAIAVRQVPDLRMVLAGEGPLRSELESLATSLDISRHIRFLGHCTDVPVLLHSLDVFVLASRFEPFGVALIEAKAAGLPVIATTVNEIPEIITDGTSGLLCGPEDPLAMSSLMVQLGRDRELRQRLALRARQEALERHSFAVALSAYQDLYSQ